MTNLLADKARAGRRAALATLNARLATGANVVSIYQGRMPARRVAPEFHSVRNHQPVLVLTERVAA